MITEVDENHLSHRKQHGIVLVWALIFMTLLALGTWYAVEYATQASKIASNEQEQLTARAAAEAALNDAQQDLSIADGSMKVSGALCARNGLLRTTTPLISTAEFPGSNNPTGNLANACANGQCAPNSVQIDMPFASATKDKPGAAWWPQSKGGIWNDDFKTYPTTFTCTSSYTGATPLGFYTGASNLQSVARQPEYIIEYIDPSLYSNFLPNIASGVEINFQCQVPLVNPITTSHASFTDSRPSLNYINVKCLLFRITARGFSQTGNNEVMLQTFVSKSII
jgi:type IV pilus assembly protein PilX